MALNYVNGISTCKFTIEAKPGTQWLENKVHLISNYCPFIFQEDEEIWAGANRRALDLTLKQRFRGIIKYFTLDFRPLFANADAMKIKEILNADRAGCNIWMQPAQDNNNNIYRVSQVPERRRLGKTYGANPFNKDYMVTFQTVKPVIETDWTDPNQYLSQTAPTGEGIDNLI